MKIRSLFHQGRPLISFEFFPPKTEEGHKNLMQTISSLKELSPSFVSMTYGAGGSTRSTTIELVSTIKNRIGLEAVAHLTCVCHNREELSDILKELQDRGIENVLALRGDPPKGQTQFAPAANGFRYASELVVFIKERFPFCIGVAGYPEKHVEAPTFEEDLKHLASKVKAGGDFIVTQLFFDANDYFSFVSRMRALGVTVPVVAGIMPVTDFDQTKKFTSMCGAKIPESLMKALVKVSGDKEAVLNIGINHAVSQCRALLSNGAPGIHFYTLNKSRATREIFLRLKKEGLV